MLRKKRLLRLGIISASILLLTVFVIFLLRGQNTTVPHKPIKTVSESPLALGESVTLEEALEVYQWWKQHQKSNTNGAGTEEQDLTSSTLQPTSFQKNLPEDPEIKECDWPLPKRISISHSEGQGQGFAYTTNYTTLMALFGPDYKVGHMLPLVDVRAHRFNDNSYAANVGMVLRYIPKNFCQVLGLNAYYDYRQGFKRPHSQIGLGVEVLSKRWDFRANAYAPVGSLKQTKSCLFDQYEGGYYIFNRRTESSFYSFNAEFGWLMINSDPFLLYWATGPYYLSGKFNDRAAGWEMRMRPQIRDYFAIDFKVSYDPLFKTVFQAQIFVTIPLYQLSSSKRKSGPCGMTDRQIYQPVERFEVPPIKRRSCWKTNY